MSILSLNTADALEDRLRALEAENASLRGENVKLKTVRDALIRQVDRSHDFTGNAFKLFQSVAELETSVEKRIQRVARAMSEAKIARRQLQQAIDSIGEGFILYDSDDRIVLCNRKYRNFFPMMEDLLKPGTHFQEIVRRAADEAVVAEAVTDPQAWIAARTERHRRKRCQFQQLLSDGRWIQFSERDTDEGGKVVIVSDITHFKRLEETRRLTKADKQSGVLVTTVASIAQGVVVFDDELKLVAWNSQAAMLLNLPYVDVHQGMAVGALLKLIWSHGARVPSQRKIEARFWIANVTKRYPLRLEIFYPGGRVVAANFRTMPDDGFVITLTDVTAQIDAARVLERSKEELEQRVIERTAELTELNEILHDEVRRHEKTAADLERARRAAEEANLSKTRFLAAASHDLLQPLNAARLYLSALENSTNVQPHDRELLDSISQAFHSTEDLLSALLDISKMDAGGYRPQPVAIDLGALFRNLETEFGALARQHGIRLRIVKSSAVVCSDPQLLRRIVQNFLSNALKYTASGSILIGARHAGGRIRIEVHDTGAGIAPEDHKVIFEEFKRASATAQATSGLGLGLAIVERAARLLDHPIGLHSRPNSGGVGGSCFSVTVPLAARGASGGREALPGPRTPAHQDPASGPAPVFIAQPPAHVRARHPADQVIFVLENDAEVSRAMTKLLDSWRLNNVCAASFDAMLEIARRRGLRPSVIIADLHLDGALDGIDAITRLRRELDGPDGPATPGILVTADQTRENTDRAKAASIEYFPKPVKPGQLRAYLSHLAVGA
ncbi:PAS-domain containing protein [Breoghania sp. L-A4]|uniref:PAS-domain containing protein n=1 Tax=Breoghania sp. L-A4 TaxID=2304600 RepID=UPI000E35EBF6|nr:PAS-domain containing protein [Breoghania sp. L-A4]AXS39741.1 response regulator [Breoghania sp. L-A4]